MSIHHNALDTENLEHVIYLIRRNIKITQLFPNACTCGNVYAVHYLTLNGYNSPERIEWSLETAAVHNHLPVVKYLIENGVNVLNRHALMMAAAFGHINIIRYLLNIRNKNDLNMVLIVVTQHGYTDIIVHLLKEYWTDVNINGWQVLFGPASQRNYLNTIRFMVENGAPVDYHMIISESSINRSQIMMQYLDEHLRPNT